MAYFEVDLDLLSQREAWPDTCARCGASSTTLIPVPDKWNKKQNGWHVPLCARHTNDWEMVRRRNRIGILAVMGIMLLSAVTTYFVQPLIAGPGLPHRDSQLIATLMIGLFSGVPAGLGLVLWAKNYIRIEGVQGRFATVMGTCKAFARACEEHHRPDPVPLAEAEMRFEVETYRLKPVSSPPAAGLLFLATFIISGLLGALVGGFSSTVEQKLAGYPPDSWNYLWWMMLINAIATAIIMDRQVLLSRIGFSFYILIQIGLLLLSMILRWIALDAWIQFGLDYSLAPLCVLYLKVIKPIIWHGRIRQPVLVGSTVFLAGIVYPGVAYLASGGSLSWLMKFLYIGAPIFTILLARSSVNRTSMPYCESCTNWLEQKRLGAFARNRVEMLLVLESGSLLSLAQIKTYQEKASIKDTEIVIHYCAKCRGEGTLIVELQDCRETGKNKTPTLFTSGRWQYPGAALEVICRMFPHAVPTPEPLPGQNPEDAEPGAFA